MTYRIGCVLDSEQKIIYKYIDGKKKIYEGRVKVMGHFLG